ncbi:MAG: EAL domain-containing protein [Hahellaceae bacterium]|nr:EAL domain-containing protein [Hahellaceae bacterium]MCP5212542.1 EAL domain-containing protein [Hahellaceae bacterium]
MTQNDAQTALTALQQKYVAALPARLSHISQLWDNLKQVNWSEKNLSSLYTLVHQLAGNGKTFGYEQLSLHASELEMMLMPLVESGLPPSAAEKKGVENKIKLLQKSGLKDPDPQPPMPLASVAENHGRIFVVDDDPVSLTYFELVLQDLGYEVARFQYLKDLYAALKTQTPDLLIMDVVLTEGKMAGIDAIQKVRALCHEQLPIVVISARTDFVAKLKAVREGANGFLVKPISDVQILKSIIEDNLHTGGANDQSVLVIDDDEYLAESLMHVLNAAGYQARAINNPAEIFKALDVQVPQVILMDFHMPHCSGIELAEMLRQDERYMTIPVVFLSTERSLEIQQQAVSLTGNEFLVKPVEPKKLQAILANVIQQSRRLRSQINSVSQYQLGSRLVNQQWFFAELEAIVSAAQNQPRSHYLSYIILDKTQFLRQRLGWTGMVEFSDQFGQWLAVKVGEGNYLSQGDNHAYLLITQPLTPVEADEYHHDLVKRIAKKEFTVAQSQISATVSIGYYRIDQQTAGVDSALSQVEQGANDIVKQGGNTAVLWTGQTVAEKAEVSQVDDSIANAVRNKAFRLVYQPIVNLDTNEKFFEALVRIQDDKNKLILPAQFMPYIKQRQLEFELDRWVFESTIKTLQSYSTQEQEALTLFVKLAPVDKDLNRYIPFISNVLRNSSLRGKQKLYLQVSESWALTNQDRLQKNMRDMRAFGCGFVLDHAGVDEHSIALINRLAPDFIRLDSSLIQSMSNNKAQQAKIKALLTSSQEASIKVIAGNVEDASTFAQLWGMGVRYFQGYFIQQPDPKLNFEPVDL